MYKNIIQWIFEYIKNIYENELVIRLGVMGAIGAVLAIAAVRIINKLIIIKRRHKFSKHYGNIILPRNVQIKKRKESGANHFKLRYPHWNVEKTDGTADLRIGNNYIIWEESVLYVDEYIVISEVPYVLLYIVKELRSQGIVIDLCREEKLKKVQLLKKKQVFIDDGSIKKIVDYYSEKPTDFEKFCADLFASMGYKYKLTPPTNDGGYDILLIKNGEKVIVECKCYFPDNNIGRPYIQKLVGANQIVGADKMLFITTSDYSAAAVTYAEEAGVELINDLGLLKLLKKQGFLTKENAVVSDKECELQIKDMQPYVPKDIYEKYFI